MLLKLYRPVRWPVYKVDAEGANNRSYKPLSTRGTRDREYIVAIRKATKFFKPSRQYYFLLTLLTFFKRMWSYYGSKANLVQCYPKPKHDLVIEPFAGSARYALEYFDRDVLLVDKYEVIIKIWKWLQQCSERDILSLPRNPEKGKTLQDFNFDCDEARLLYGFVCGFGMSAPRKKPSYQKLSKRPNFINFTLNRIAENLFKIKHWTIQHGDYREIGNHKATWFIDPPYQFGGHAYVMSNRKIDFEHLAQWCKGRNGQVIVCENMKADWLPFKPLRQQKTLKRTSTEAIWSNHATAFDNEQLKIAI